MQKKWQQGKQLTRSTPESISSHSVIKVLRLLTYDQILTLVQAHWSTLCKTDKYTDTLKLVYFRYTKHNVMKLSDNIIASILHYLP